MKSKNKIIGFIILVTLIIILSFLSSRDKNKDIKNSSGQFSPYNGYLTKINDYVIFRNCKGNISYHTLIPTKNIDEKLVINKPTYVNIKASISNTISEVDEIKISKEESCEGNTNPVYLANIFAALKEVSENEALIQDGTNFKSSEALVSGCTECLLYMYEFEHYSIPDLHYKNELLIKNGVIIERENSQ